MYLDILKKYKYMIDLFCNTLIYAVINTSNSMVHFSAEIRGAAISNKFYTSFLK